MAIQVNRKSADGFRLTTQKAKRKIPCRVVSCAHFLCACTGIFRSSVLRKTEDFMIYKYEMACREAGLPEEQIAEIRRMFDAEYKRLGRRKKAKETNNISWISTADMSGADSETEYELADENTDVEGMVLHQLELEELQGYLDELTEDDRKFLLAMFEDVENANQRMAEKLGLTIGQVRYRKEKLLKMLRARFEEK
ncbi:MAG: RNA polymerase sigma factor [Chordicoccus sp.]